MEISPFVINKTNQLLEDCFYGESIYAKEILKYIDEMFYLIDEEQEKLYIIQTVLEKTNSVFEKHQIKCPSKTCQEAQNRDEIDFMLKRELKKLDVVIPSDSFTAEEKQAADEIVDHLIKDFQEQLKNQNEKLEIIISELNELKNLHVIGKKNWKQQIIGKLTEMTISGVISEVVSKPLIDQVTTTYFPYIKNLLE